MRIGIFGRDVKKDDAPFFKKLFDALQTHQIEYAVYSDFVHQMADKNFYDIIPIAQLPIFEAKDCPKSRFDFILSIGGDGTLLNTVSLVGKSAIPVIGVNSGRLGLLADINKQEVEDTLVLLQNGHFELDRRGLLCLTSNKPLFEDGHNYALNEFTVLKQDTSAMIIVHVFANDIFLNSYWADGVIVATPTGSTAYSLSCGGPIVHPNSRTFLITPIAPHNLNVRPVVIPDTVELTFRIEGRNDNFLCTLDSRYKLIDKDYNLSVKKADFDFCLVRIMGDQRNFFTTIRQKMMWGLDTRN